MRTRPFSCSPWMKRFFETIMPCSETFTTRLIKLSSRVSPKFTLIKLFKSADVKSRPKISSVSVLNVFFLSIVGGFSTSVLPELKNSLIFSSVFSVTFGSCLYTGSTASTVSFRLFSVVSTSSIVRSIGATISDVAISPSVRFSGSDFEGR